jgi:hypothetical protein
MKPISTLLTLLAVSSLTLAPFQQALAAATVNFDLAKATGKLNKAHTLGSVLEALRGDSELAGEFSTLIRERKLNTDSPLPAFIPKGNSVIITGYSQPIIFTSMRPLAIKVAGATWTYTKGDTATQAYDSLSAFMKTKSSKGMGYLYDLVIPSAHAGEFELYMGGLMGIGFIYALDNNSRRAAEAKAKEKKRDEERDEMDEMDRQDKIKEERIAKEEATFVEKTICTPEFSDAGKKLMAKNGPPKIQTITNEMNYGMFRYRENKDGAGSDTVAIAWDFGDGHFETIEYQLKRGKEVYNSEHSFQGYEGDFGFSAKIREGRPVHLFTRGSLFGGSGQDVYADNVRKNGQPLGSVGLQDVSNKEYDNELLPWKMAGAKDVSLPMAKVTEQQRSAVREPKIIAAVCSQPSMAGKVMARNGVPFHLVGVDSGAEVKAGEKGAE